MPCPVRSKFKTACRKVRAAEFNPRSRRSIRKFYKARNFNLAARRHRAAKANLNAAPPRLNLAPADLCLSRASVAQEAACLNFKFTPPDADFTIRAQRKSAIPPPLVIKFNRAGRRAMRANLKRAVFITAQISNSNSPIKIPPQARDAD